MDFDFIRNGMLYSVHTKVGEGPAAVTVQERELQPQGDESIEHSDEVVS